MKMTYQPKTKQRSKEHGFMKRTWFYEKNEN